MRSEVPGDVDGGGVVALPAVDDEAEVGADGEQEVAEECHHQAPGPALPWAAPSGKPGTPGPHTCTPRSPSPCPHYAVAAPNRVAAQDGDGSGRRSACEFISSLPTLTTLHASPHSS